MPEPTPLSAPPGVHVAEIDASAPPITPVAMSDTLFLGFTTRKARLAEDLRSFADYAALPNAPADVLLGASLRGFFLNGGKRAAVLWLPRFGAAALAEAFAPGGLGARVGFNLLCAPGRADVETALALQRICRDRRAFLILDAPEDDDPVRVDATARSMMGPDAGNAALYFPWLRADSDAYLPPSGYVAGLLARLDDTRGIWAAPAGVSAAIFGARDLARPAPPPPIVGALLHKGVNCLRRQADGAIVLWGARTLAPNLLEQRYVPVRRLTLMLEESLLQGLTWVTFEPNDAALWTRVRNAVAALLTPLMRQGAFASARAEEAFFVTCDDTVMTPADIAAGRLLVRIGFAPLKPGEFVNIILNFRVASPAP